ncbi:hypothetical protein ASC90_21400 [Rhizobium sp. Root1220]|nr:hypothetical protein ASC90_21400 [Rhizobium sp. Root1220]
MILRPWSQVSVQISVQGLLGFFDGKAPACAGPWLKPSLDRKGWSIHQGKIIVADALKRFRRMLKGLQVHRANNFYVVETQGTFQDPYYRRQWINELHPSPAGFELVARKFDEHWFKLVVERGELTEQQVEPHTT